MIIGRLRAVSGTVLLAYVVTHLGNHAVALWSLEAADALLQALSGLWRSAPVTALLLAAFVTHLGVALHAIWRRRTLRMSRWEWAQLLLGLSIVPLGMTHVVGTRVAHELHGVHTNHLWVLWPMAADAWQCTRQFALMLAVWTHACIGLHFWWRVKPWYAQALPLLYAAALLLPALALAGASVGLGHVLALMDDPQRMAAAVAQTRPPSRQEVAELNLLTQALNALALILLVASLGARAVTQHWLRRRQGMELQYPDGRSVRLACGVTVLEASRVFGVAHASVCGGRGRCSTCRVRIDGADAAKLPPPDVDEARVLARLAAPPQVRLACQLRPLPGRYCVTPLLPAGAQPSDAYRGEPVAVGEERVIAVMFVDLRGFTALSEKRLPYDLVFILNRYFALVGEAVQDAGGRIDKFIGDGVMALFGLQGTPREAARDALRAALAIGRAVQRLNETLVNELSTPLRVGIGLHLGPAVVGVLGWGPATGLTAIGDTVNTASRLESLSKEHDAELLVSQPVFDHAGLTTLPGQGRDVAVRGRSQALPVRVVPRAEDLALTLS